MKIDRALLLHLERLAHLELGESERAAMAADLTRILDYAESLSLDAEAGETTAASPSPLREDEPAASLAPALLAALAPRWEQGHFQVPPVLGRPETAADLEEGR